MRFLIHTLGCKVNQHESQQMSERLAELGIMPAEDGEADVVIVNSCAVTAVAEQKTRQLVRRARREHPGAIICLTGCVPQAYPEHARELSEADIVIGNSNRERLPELIAAFAERRERTVCVEPHGTRSGLDGGIARMAERTRAYIKIEDGCNRFCAYCVIPYARGRVRSRSLDDIAREAHALAESGFREVVLVGINLSAYGQDCGLGLTDAVNAVAAVDGIERIRFGSVEPDLISDELLDSLARNGKFCPQFHMSIQSGCDATLARMNRRYDTAYYAALVERIFARFDNPSITTDIMVGFPGETDEEFEQSLAFAQRIGFARAHCFAYSRREGTVAATLPDQVAPAVMNDRSARMIAAMSDCAARFMETQIGRRAQVLIEREVAPGLFEGYTENYTAVRLDEPCERGELADLIITGVEGEYCTATRC